MNTESEEKSVEEGLEGLQELASISKGTKGSPTGLWFESSSFGPRYGTGEQF